LAAALAAENSPPEFGTAAAVNPYEAGGERGGLAMIGRDAGVENVEPPLLFGSGYLDRGSSQSRVLVRAEWRRVLNACLDSTEGDATYTRPGLE
jgi:hypothetical protein